MAKKAAYGTRLIITDPADSSLFRVHHVADISGPEINVETVDVTSHDSPDGFAQFVAGTADAGELAFELFFDPSDGGHARLMEMADERAVAEITLLLPKAPYEFISDPDFQGGDWVLGTGWTVDAAGATYTSANPAGETIGLDISSALTLEAEPYVLEVLFSSNVAGSTPIIVILDGVSIGTVNPAILTPQRIYFDATASHGLIEFEVPASIAVTTTFTLQRVSLKGVLENNDERFDFSGLITKVGILAPVKGALTAPVSIKVSGKPQYEPAA